MDEQIIELTEEEKNRFLGCLRPIWYYDFESEVDVLEAILRIIGTSIFDPKISERSIHIMIDRIDQEKILIEKFIIGRRKINEKSKYLVYKNYDLRFEKMKGKIDE